MNAIVRDLRQAARTLANRPGLTASAVATIALAIGVGTSIFSIVNSILIQPLPYKDPEQLVMVWNLNERTGYGYEQTRSQGYSMSPAEFLDWQDAEIFESMTLFWATLRTVTDDQDPEMVHGYALSPGGFRMLGVEPMLGRLPTLEEQRAEAPVVVLRHNLWKRRFHEDPSVIGQALEMDGVRYEIVGVMPPEFVFFNRQSEFLAPLSFGDGFWEERRGRLFRVMARLKPGMPLREAQARATRFSEQMEQQFPDANQGWRVRLYPLAEETAGELRGPLTALFGAAVFVLLIMCANLANLLLVHAASRSRELAVRAALGAGRGRLARLMMSESLLLAAVGGAGGLAVAYLLVRGFQSAAPGRFTHGKYLLQLEAIGVDLWVVLFAFAAALVAGLLFGAAPAWRATRMNFNEDLKESARGSSGTRRTASAYGLLVVAEVAFSVVLAVGAMLLVRSFDRLYAQGAGFEPERLLTLIVTIPISSLYAELEGDDLDPAERSAEVAARTIAGRRLLLREIEAVPEVETAAATLRLPIQGWFQAHPFIVEGRPIDRPEDQPKATYTVVTANFFETFGIPLIEGRMFGPQDRPDSLPVCVISDETARRYWPGESPLGARLGFLFGANRNPRWATVVGVVGNVREGGMDAPPTVSVYASADQRPFNRIWIAAKTHGDPSAAVRSVTDAVRRVDSSYPIYRIRTMSDMVRDSAWRLNYSMALLGGLAVLALVLAAIGVYSVLSYSVRGRTRELGVRMALGAERSTLRRMVLGQGLRLVVIGLVIGWLASVVLTRFLSALLFGVQPLDPIAYAVTGVLLLTAGAAASYFPALRATRVEPVEALRHQ